MPLYEDSKKSQEQTDFQIELLAIEIKELENSKRNQQIFEKVKEKERENFKQFLTFKQNFQNDLKSYMWPYGTLSIFTGIMVVRSLVFGSIFGLAGGKFAKSMYERFITTKSI